MATRSSYLHLALGLMLAIPACTGLNVVQKVSDSSSGGGSSGAGGSGHGGASGVGGAPAQDGLPCDVAKVLADACLGCHGNPLAGGAPMPLVTYDDLNAVSPKGGNYASRSLVRMKDAAAPMPPLPAPAVSATDIATFESWVTASLPKGECNPTGSGGGSSSSSSSSGAGGAPPQTGLPCDVAEVFGSCVGCHKSPPSGGATMPLVTYADLTAASPKGGTYASRSVIRMADLASPMPPQPAAAMSAAQIAAVQAWISAGQPMGTCEVGGSDGGVVQSPYDTPDTCTRAITWAGGEQDWGNYPKTAMHPGEKCLDCHAHPGNYNLPDNGPSMWFGGTVYPTAHELEECFGVDGQQTGATVEITDANGQVVSAKVGVSGNFYLRKGANVPPIVFPIHAKVLAGGKTRAMSQEVQHGDCNVCHTLHGDQNAPGRIMLP
jgi:mono/diheme cytochrome c family protein